MKKKMVKRSTLHSYGSWITGRMRIKNPQKQLLQQQLLRQLRRKRPQQQKQKRNPKESLQQLGSL